MKHGAGAIVTDEVRRGGSEPPAAMTLAVSEPRLKLDSRGAVVLALVAGLAAVVLVVYWDTFLSILQLWRSAQHGHGVLVFPIAAYLLWRLREPLARIELQPTWWGAIPLLGFVLLWFVSATIGIQAVEQFAAVLLIPATVLTFLGRAFARRALFPLLFIVAAVPIGDGLIPYLMRTTANLATVLLGLVGVPVFRQGQFLTLPGGAFEIADVCAGMQYLTAGTIIGALTAYLTFQSNLKRFVWVLAFAVAMVLTNGLRAFVVMFVASASDMRYLAGADHVYFGWILFAAVIATLIYLAGRRGDDVPDDLAEAAAQTAAASPLLPSAALVAALLLVAVGTTVAEGPPLLWLAFWPAAALLAFGVASAGASPPLRRYRPAALAVGAAAAVLGAGPVLLAKRLDAAVVASPTLELPAIEGCAQASEWSAGGQPQFASADATAAATYECAGVPVSVFVAAYSDNVQGRELVSDANRLAPDEWRRVTTPQAQRFDLGDGASMSVNELQLDAGSRWLVWYWYVTGGDAETSGAVVKLKQAAQLLLEGRADGTAYVLQTPLDATIESSRQRLARAVRSLQTP
jgi:exosortase A